jgi:hypothetical protein
MQRCPCLCCLSPDGALLKLDKKGHPYTVCSCCGSRTFMHSRAALRGLQLLAPKLIALWEHASQSAEQRTAVEHSIDQRFESLKASTGRGGF